MNNKVIIKEYLGNKIEFTLINGNVYANATSMCKVFSKNFADWKRLKQTEDMINEVSSEMGITISDLVLVTKGGKSTEQGSLIHEELVLELASWLDVKFRRWCQKQIATLIREGSVSVNTPKTYIEALEALLESEKQKQKLLIENDKQKKDIEHKKNLIDNLTENVDGVLLRKTCTDYVNKISYQTAIEHKVIYKDIYTLAGRALKKDLYHSYKAFKENENKIVQFNKSINKENKDNKDHIKLMPHTLAQSKFYISMVEYIVDILGKGIELLECMAKVFEVGIDEIIEKYNYFKEHEHIDFVGVSPCSTDDISENVGMRGSKSDHLFFGDGDGDVKKMKFKKVK